MRLGFGVLLLSAGLVASCKQILGLDDFRSSASNGSGGSNVNPSQTGPGAGGAAGGGGASPVEGWARSWGAEADERLSGLAVDDGDRILLAGNHGGPFDDLGAPVAHAGGSDLFIAKLDANGEPLWAEGLGDAQDQYALAITRYQDLIYVTGMFSGTIALRDKQLVGPSDDQWDGFVVRFDDEGTPNSGFEFPGANVQFPGVIVSAPLGVQNLLITGHTTGDMGIAQTTIVSQSQQRGFLARIYTSAVTDWAVPFGTDGGTQTPAGIAADGSGYCVVSGSFTGSMNVGTGIMSDVGGPDGFVAKFLIGEDAAVWAVQLSSSGSEPVARVALATDGDALVAGTFSAQLTHGSVTIAPTIPDPDLFLARFESADGALVWMHSYGVTGSANVRALTMDHARGTLWLGGDFSGTLTFDGTDITSVSGRDLFVAALDPSNGDTLHVRGYGEPTGGVPGDQFLTGLALRSDGGVVIGGYFDGQLDIDGTVLTADGADSFVALVAPR